MAISNQEKLVSEIPSVDSLKSKILNYRQREKFLDKWLNIRMSTILPALMKRTEIDCWIICNEEYNEDPVYWTLTPFSWITARRLTIMIYYLNEEGNVEKYSITRYPIEGYQQKWTNTDISQMDTLAAFLKELNPEKIGFNMSKDFAYADGLSHTLYQAMYDAFDDELRGKIVSAEKLAVGWLETRSEEEMAAYNDIVQIAHTMIAEAYSNKVIHPGVTTADDVKYWMMQKTVDLGLEPWFDYEVSITRFGGKHYEGDEIIMPGDMLHCDIGFRYLNLCTDTQELCYILKMDEDDVPEDLKKAMAVTNRLQDITKGEFITGRTGNEILRNSLQKAKSEGINATIYTHPLGFHGHAAGPTIGLWDKQGGVEGSGDYPLYDNTAYSLELNAKVYVESMGGEIPIAMETDILYKGGKVYYLAGRQTEFHKVK
ncbi:MAG: M24 family metallopeptidase [Erysipelotrichaceae bacterium]|nr:M24 family metallopeptidase [Erysipelotrichaceae bacterium]